MALKFNFITTKLRFHFSKVSFEMSSETGLKPVFFPGPADEQGPPGARLEDQGQLAVHRPREVPLVQEELPGGRARNQTLRRLLSIEIEVFT